MILLFFNLNFETGVLIFLVPWKITIGGVSAHYTDNLALQVFKTVDHALSLVCSLQVVLMSAYNQMEGTPLPVALVKMLIQVLQVITKIM